MVSNNYRFYGNKKGATIPVMTRVSIEAYQDIAKISEATNISINQVTLMFLEYALANAQLEECKARRIKFRTPMYQPEEDRQEGDTNE